MYKTNVEHNICSSLVTSQPSSDRNQYISWGSNVHLQLNNVQKPLNIIHLGAKTVYLD